MKDNRLWRGKHIFAVWAVLTVGMLLVNWLHELNFNKIQDWSLGTYCFVLISFPFNFYAGRYWLRYLAGPQARLYPLDILTLLTCGVLCCIALFEHRQQGLRVLPLYLALFALFSAYMYFDSHRQKLDQDANAETSEPADDSK